MSVMSRANLYRWCSVPARDLPTHADLRVRFRMVRDSAEMGMLMARELADEIEGNNKQSRPTRAIIPCGPKCWYAPFTELVNARKVSLRSLFVFHMDECLDWQGRLLTSHYMDDVAALCPRVILITSVRSWKNIFTVGSCRR